MVDLRAVREWREGHGRAGIAEAWVFYFFAFVLQAAALSLDVVLGWKQQNVVDWVAWYPAA